MKTIGTIIAQPVSSYQLEAMKAFMLALDIKFELQIANENSEKEIRASEAERASIKYKQVEYMMDRIGQTFDGTITGVTQWGGGFDVDRPSSRGVIVAGHQRGMG